MAFDLVIRNTSEILPATGDPALPREQALAPVPRAALGITQGRVAFLGPEVALPADQLGPGTRSLDARGGFVGPGFVDPHTHLVFAGDRSGEFALRCRGATYQEIARAGGGIMNTVRATRAASEDALVASAAGRLERLLEQGVTTAEVKSGYGLSAADELKMLRVIQRLATSQPVSLVPTLLCAHAVPEEHRADRDRYVSICVEEIIPAVADARLAVFCDAFVEEGAFTVAEARRILSAAQARGMVPRVHAEQMSSCGGALLAAELGAACADHLEQIDEPSMTALARAGTTAVLVPASTFFLKQRRYAPGRMLLDRGVSVALATNVNPGSAMSENAALTLSLACLENGLTPSEAYWGFTRGAGNALRLPHAGRLAVGDPADCAVFSCASHTHLPYHLATPHVAAVVKGGQVVFERSLPPCA
jgi:imidazolonepropionase